MEGYIKLTANEFVVIINTLEEHRVNSLDIFARVFKGDLFGPPWYYGDDGNLYIQEVIK